MIESVLESHEIRASAFELSIVQIGLETAEIRVGNATRIAAYRRGQARVLVLAVSLERAESS